MFKFIAFALTLSVSTLLMASANAGAFNFQEPTAWTVGDPGSTMQNWEASEAVPFLNVNTLPTISSVNPAVTTQAKMSVQSPGIVASSGGYYSQNNSYRVFANIYNHAGSFGAGGQYATGYGTKVRVQTAGTTNPDSDASVFQNSIELLKLDNSALPGGANANLLTVTELYRQQVETPFGLAHQQELLFEFYLPAYSGDFRVRFTNALHSSFQELRVDTMLILETTSIPGDFDGDDDVDADDLADWQASYGINGAADADGDGDSDGRDFLIWQRNYTGPGTIVAFTVPEPTSLLVVIFGIIMGLTSRTGCSRAI
jgi:hypothetical protein